MCVHIYVCVRREKGGGRYDRRLICFPLSHLPHITHNPNKHSLPQTPTRFNPRRHDPLPRLPPIGPRPQGAHGGGRHAVGRDEFDG